MRYVQLSVPSDLMHVCSRRCHGVIGGVAVTVRVLNRILSLSSFRIVLLLLLCKRQSHTVTEPCPEGRS